MKIYLYIVLIPLLIGACTSSKTTSSANDKEENGLTYSDQSRLIKMLFEGERAEMKNDPIKALSYYRECLSIDPSSDVAYFKIASIYFSQGNYQSATINCKKAIEIESNNKWYYLLLTKSYLGISEIELATETFAEILEMEPDNIDYQLEMLELYAQQRNFTKAIEMLDDIEEKHGKSPEFNIRKQDFYMANGQADKAIETCQELISRHPEEANFYGLLAILYESNGEKEKELATYIKLIEIDSTNGLAHLKLSNIYQERGEKEKSEREMLLAFKSRDLDIDVKINVLTQYYQKLLVNDSSWPYVDSLLHNLEISHPDDARTYSVYSDFLSLKKDFSKSREYLVKSLEIQKDRFQIWNQLIIVDSELQDWESLTKHGEQALELFPSNPVIYYYLGIGYFQLEEYEDAIEILETGKMMIFKSESGLVDFYVLLGDSYNALKKYSESDDNYDLALKANPDNAYVLNNFAYYLSLRKEHLEKAEEMAKKAVELEPSQYNYQDTYGWVLFQAQKYDEAKKWLKLAVDNGGDINGEIIEHYGDALYKSGNVEEAILIWKRAKSVGDASELIDEKIKTNNYIEN
jgi:tetratricopeptide (TPR) repeat protein